MLGHIFQEVMIMLDSALRGQERWSGLLWSEGHEKRIEPQ